jgi:hypothetical protein
MSAETNKFLNSDALKSVITDKSIVINTKNVPERFAENVANLIMCSNNSAPIRIDGDDRRYVVTQSSSKYKGNTEYFAHLFDLSQQKEFKQLLFSYFMKKDLSKFDPRKLPMTEAKQDIQDASKSPYQLFIQEHIQNFIEGWICENAYQTYAMWARNNGFAVCNVVNFGKNLKTWCDHKQIREEGRRPYKYRLKEDQRNHFEIPEEE